VVPSGTWTVKFIAVESMFAEEEKEEKLNDNYFRLSVGPQLANTRASCDHCPTPLTAMLATATVSGPGCGLNSRMQLARPEVVVTFQDVADVRSAPHFATQLRGAVLAGGPLTPSW